MKSLIISLVLLVFSGCSHAYVKGWGNGQIVACCPSHKLACTESNLNEFANDHCGGAATPIGGEAVDGGGLIGSYGDGLVNLSSTTDICVKYQCGRKASSINR